MYQVILYYKYVKVEDPAGLAISQKLLCKRLGLIGRIIVASEGINGTLEGKTEAIAEYAKAMRNDPMFADMNIKYSQGDGKTFPKLSVKARSEIVSSHLDGTVSPLNRTGKYLSSEELHDWFESGKEFYIVDMRNDYETQSGHFEGSILSGMGNFRDLPKVLDTLADLKNKTILTVCTGGVRCEKASAFLLENGFADVYQLKDGIVTYMEKYPNQHFKGKLYVFDQRILIAFNPEDPAHQVIGHCLRCSQFSERYVNCANDECHLHFICCENCAENGRAFCSEKCRETVGSGIVANNLKISSRIPAEEFV